MHPAGETLKKTHAEAAIFLNADHYVIASGVFPGLGNHDLLFACFTLKVTSTTSRPRKILVGRNIFWLH